MRRLILISVVAVALAGCPKPRTVPVYIPSVVSESIDISKIVPKPIKDPDLKKICKPGSRFAPRPVTDASLPSGGGFTVSECFLARATYGKARIKALKIELNAYKALRVQERGQFKLTEKAYQKHLDNLSKKRTRASWWDKSKFVIGIVVGVATSVAITLSAGKLAKDMK